MKKRRSFIHILSSLVFAAALAVAVDLIAALFAAHIALAVFVGIFIVSALLLIVLNISTKWLWMFFFVVIIAGGAVMGVALYGFNYNAGYSVEDNGKAALYSGKKVLILSPHQDDELLAVGGVIEEYIKYGSQVSLAFSTNGDSQVSGETRLNEALQVAAALNIPENKVFFLGYGDRCIDGVHMYNLPEETLVVSPADFESTYALETHPAYRQGQAYTKENLRTDLKELLLEQQADIIYCVELELHPDHSALAMLLDEAMAEILKGGSDYRPVILKSSCYATGFYAPYDFYSLNIKASTDPSGGENFADMYNWDERLRLPVNGSGLSRSIFGCDTFKQLSLHKSQNIQSVAENAINGDKVFWLRDTNSLCYDAQISVSSGIGKFLNDFKLFDNYDIYGDFKRISDNTWAPEAGDNAKTATVTLAQPSYIQRICLYDDPDKTVNVLNALITFDDGSSIETGPLNKYSVTEIEVNKDAVKSFSVKILETQGEKAGLTEIEAYSSQTDYGFDFIKVMDMDGNFVYDYYTNELGTENFLIYASGVDGEFKVSSDNPRCSVKYADGIISVKCPKDESCTITVSSEDGKYSDTVVVSNPGRFLRETGPYFERLVRQFMSGNIQQSSLYQLIKNAYYTFLA